MTSVPIEEALSLDISGALQGISQIDDALTAVTQSFAVGLASALETLTSAGADVPPLADTLDVAGLGPAVDTALSDALSAPQPPVSVEADTAPLTDAIDSATAIVPVLDVNADTTEASTAIDALAGIPVDIPVTADTTEAQDAIDALSSSATDAVGSTGGSSGGGSGLAGLEGAVLGIKAATGAAQGEVGGLRDVVGGLSSGLGTTIAGGAAFTAFLGETIKLAADAQAQQSRFNTVFGQSADIVKNIDVGGLAISFADLADKTGTATPDLEAAASKIGQLGTSSGVSQAKVADITQQLLGLGGTLAVQNPRLGDTAAVVDRLGVALTRGGRSAQQLGLDVPTKEIAALAQQIAGAGNDVSQFDKLQAGLQIALKGTGDTLGTSFAQGAQNAQVQLRELTKAIEETLIAVGGPLLQPVVESFKSLLPVAQEVGVALGELAQSVLPIVVDLAPALTPFAAVLGLVANGLGVVADAIGLIPAPVIQALAVGFVALGIAIDAAAGQLGIFGISLDVALGPIGILLGALTLLGIATHFFGGSSKQAAIDASSLDTAFTSSSSSASGFAGVLDNLNTSIDAYLKKQLAAGDAGKTGLDTANALGVGYKQIENALGGTDAQYQTFRDNLEASNAAQGISADQSQKFFDILETGRGQLEDNAKAALQGAVASGVLSQAQLDQGNAAHSAVGFNDDYGHKIVDNISVLRELAPTIDAATQRTNEQAQAATAASPAYAQLVEQFATGSITLDTFTNSLDRFGFVGTGAKDQAKAVSDALNALTSAAASALPTVGGAIDAFSQTVTSDFQKVVSDVHSGSKNVQADLKQLADDQDPKRFSDNLDAQTANVLTFTSNLATLVDQGFGTLAASLAKKGPEAAGGLAAALASDPAKARTAQGAEVLANAAASQLDVFLRAKFPQLAGLGGDAGTVIANHVLSGITGTINKDGTVQTSILTLSKKFVAGQTITAPTVVIPKPDIQGAQTAGEQTGTAAQTGFVTTFQPSAAAAAAIERVPGALLGNVQPAITAASGIANELTLGFASGLHFDNAVSQAIGFIAGSFVPDKTALAAAAGEGFALGQALGEGFAGGLSSSSGAVGAAAGNLGSIAEAAIKHALGIKSPSTVGVDIGSQFVLGIAQGMAALSPLHQATAALALALIPDLRPALKQVPSLAPAIVASSPVASRPATSPVSDAGKVPVRRIESTITLNKTDPDPKHFADELAWSLQGV